MAEETPPHVALVGVLGARAASMGFIVSTARLPLTVRRTALRGHRTDVGRLVPVRGKVLGVSRCRNVRNLLQLLDLLGCQVLSFEQ